MVDLRLGDCLELMKDIPDGSVDLVLTDIPYNGVNRKSNGLRTLDKGKADIITFDLLGFMEEIYRVASGTIIVFCGQGQLSEIFKFFLEKQKESKGTVRQIVWRKTNPSPMNGQYIYLSGVEMGVWYKKQGAKTFNARCKNTVFHYPNGRSKLHPTEKNHALLEDLIKDNTNEGQTVFDPCCGSGSHCFVAKNLGRKYIGVELDKSYFDVAVKRLGG